MASQLCLALRATAAPPLNRSYPFNLLKEPTLSAGFSGRRRGIAAWGRSRSLKIRVSNTGNEGDSYLGMWKRAVELERKGAEFQKIAGSSTSGPDGGESGESAEDLQKKSEELQKILEFSKEERDRIQRMQVIDRAAAAIAAARAVVSERNSSPESPGDSHGSISPVDEASKDDEEQQKGKQGGSVSYSGPSRNGTPGPDFWSWTPPDVEKDDVSRTQAAKKTSAVPFASRPVIEKDRSLSYLSIPFESRLLGSNQRSPVPPLQSLVEAEKADVADPSTEASVDEKHEIGVVFSTDAAEAVSALHSVEEAPLSGAYEDGSRWWRETGTEVRPGGVLCRWTLTRGVSADNVTEWEEKFWEAADQFEYKELGSEKSGRDAAGNVWRECWRESMRQESGLVHFEKTADKWGKNGKGEEWQEKWWEHYDSSGKADKWADKWCSIDPTTPVEDGHAHVWHERWGEKYDGLGGSIKYTDKWAERCEGDGWTKWGDKWDENFDPNGNGVKQGEKWWQGKHGEQWNRTWGEGHNGSGWVHKYGKSSSGEHWDTHVEQDTWYERFPHYGFWHCLENSVQLQEVKKPSETS